jgi:hypothetical protein
MKLNRSFVSQSRGSFRMAGRVFVIVLLALSMASCFQRGEGHRQLPPSIADIEEGAEEIYDLAGAARWEKADLRTRDLREMVARFETGVGHPVPELERAVAALDSAIGSQDSRRSSRCANDVVRHAVVLASGQIEHDLYAALMLDVEARSVLVEVDVDPPAADAAVARTAALWRELRLQVARRGDDALMHECDRIVRALETGDAAKRTREAKKLLDAVDRLEDLFV